MARRTAAPVRGNVRIRAARVIPFGGPVAVPLAWVDGSDPQQGGVVIVNASRRRPQIVNRRLEEMPPAGRSRDDDLPKGTLAEFAFTPPTDRSPALTPAAEIADRTPSSGRRAAAAWQAPCPFGPAATQAAGRTTTRYPGRQRQPGSPIPTLSPYR